VLLLSLMSLIHMGYHSFNTLTTKTAGRVATSSRSLPDFDASIPAPTDKQPAHTLYCLQLSDAVRVGKVLHSELAAQVRAAVRCDEPGAFTKAALLHNRHTLAKMASVAVRMSGYLNNTTQVTLSISSGAHLYRVAPG